MRALFVLIGKDLRLLWRDRAGLVFLVIAPILVISVAGFSLANLYGADPTGETAYDFPFVDEDGGELARTLRDRLAEDRSVRLHPVATREEAEKLVRDKQAGSALVVPPGTEEAMSAGKPAELILYTDAVKYLERLNVRARLFEMRSDLTAERIERSRVDAAERYGELRRALERLEAEMKAKRAEIERAWNDAKRARDEAARRTQAELGAARRNAEERIARELSRAAADAQRRLDEQAAELRSQLRAYGSTLEARRAELDGWMAELRRRAGSHASEIPEPPVFPELPASLRRFLDSDASPLRVPVPSLPNDLLAPAPRPALPELPAPPAIEPPRLELGEPPAPPGSLAVREVNLSGGSSHINTFDQNVPGFSVTFLLLGMLLGVSLALLDERDWGTLERLRAMPIAAGNVLVAKLASRFVVGMIQMIALFAFGALAFGVSLGPEPWALLLPTAGIVLAGTAFGVVVASVAPSREAVLPLGSIVIVTMAAVGGCWWPIDLEPRWMRSVALAFPTTWAMDAFNDLMIRRRGIEAALKPTAVLLGYAAVYLGIGLALFRRRTKARSR